MAGRVLLISGSDLAELPSGQSVPIAQGGTGATTAAAALTSLGAAASTDLTAGVGTDTATSGTSSKRSYTVTATPGAATTQQLHAEAITIKYTSSYAMNSSGWIVSLRLENQLLSAASIDKSVVAAAYTTGVGGGRIDKALGYEAVISGLDGTTSINQYAGFYSANLAAVPGIANITAPYAFANDWSGASYKNAGRYLKAMDAAGGVPAAPHPGYITDRYYGPPMAFSASPLTLVAQFAYPMLFQVNERTTFSKIGCRITTAGASGTTLRLGIYYVEGGLPSGLIYDSGALSAATAGDVEKTGVATTLEAGMYALVIVSTGTPALQSVLGFDVRNQWGRSTSSGEETLPLFAVGTGALPSAFSAAFAWYSAGGAVPDIWMRK